MKYDNISGAKTLNQFVTSKLNKYEKVPHDFKNLYDFMFSEKDNILWESNNGFRISKVTYGQCRCQIEAKAAFLKNMLNLQEQSVVAIYMDNSLEWIEMFWATLRCGWNPILLNLRLNPEIIEDTLSKMNVQAVISDSAEFKVKTVFVKDIQETEELLPADNNFGNEIYLMSSGTSSHVKICAYSGNEFYFQIKNSFQIITRCAQIKKHYNGQLKLLTFLPFYHIFGLSAVYIWFGFFSRTFVYLKDLSPDTILNTIRKHEVTHIFAVPLFWETVYNQAMRTIRLRGDSVWKKFNKGLKLSKKIGDVPVLGNLFIKKAFQEVRDGLFGDSINFLITGGSAVKPEVLEFFNGIGYHFANGYGMTEIGITAVELSSSRRILSSGSIGMPVSSIEYKINEEGELLIKGDGVAKFIIEGDTRTDYKNNWFNSHDLACQIKGRYYILGRKDDLVVSASGENLNPNLIESKLTGDGINEVCLLNDSLPVLLVSTSKFISQEKMNLLAENLKSKLHRMKLTGQINKIVYTSDSFIKGNEFKLNRKRLLAEYKAGSLTPVIPFNPAEENELSSVALTVRKYFALALNKDEQEIGLEADFFTDEGGTSLDYLSLIAQLQNEFSVSFSSNQEESFSTVKSISAFIEEKL